MIDDLGAAVRAWPDELTPELSDILGRQCFTFIRLSQLYRAAGYEIPTKAEDEQAFFLHRMLRAWFEAGEGWLDVINRELRAVKEVAIAKAEATPHPQTQSRTAP